MNPEPKRTAKTDTTAKPTIRLLHIEDNAQDAFLVRMHLDAMPGVAFDVDIAGTLRQALEAPVHRYAAALVDLDLPDSRGMDTVRAVRGRFPQLPVVVLTGRREKALGLQALGLGVHHYMVKDEVTPDNLGRHLVQAVERARSQVQVSPAGPIARKGGIHLLAPTGAWPESADAWTSRQANVVLATFRRSAKAARSALESAGMAPDGLAVVDAASPRKPTNPREMGLTWVGPRDLDAIATAIEDSCAYLGRGYMVVVDDLAALAEGRSDADLQEFLSALSSRLAVLGVPGSVLLEPGRKGEALASRVAPMIKGGPR